MNRNQSFNTVSHCGVVANTQIIIGFILAGFDLSMAILGCFNIKELFDVILIFFFLVLFGVGLFFIIEGIKRKHLISEFRLYIEKLSQDPNKSLARLSYITKVPVYKIKIKINKMIGYGFFINAYIDETDNTLVYLNSTAKSKASSSQNQITYVTVKCSGCGATNRIVKGTVGKCEFCGAYISDNDIIYSK